MSKRGNCPVCGGLFVLKRDGTLRQHTDQTKPLVSNIWAPTCDGVNRYPVKEN